MPRVSDVGLRVSEAGAEDDGGRDGRREGEEDARHDDDEEVAGRVDHDENLRARQATGDRRRRACFACFAGPTGCSRERRRMNERARQGRRRLCGRLRTTTIQKSIQKSAGWRSLRLRPAALRSSSGANATRLTESSTWAATPDAPAIQNANVMEACVPKRWPASASRIILGFNGGVWCQWAEEEGGNKVAGAKREARRGESTHANAAKNATSESA